MDNLKALGRGTQLMFVSAVLLIIVSFLRWQEVSVSLGAIGSVSGGRNALHGFWGWIMFLLTIVLVARIAARLAAVEIPIPLSFATTSFVLGILIAVCAVLKVITDDYTKFWAYIGVALAILVAIGAWLEVKEAGGVEHLRSEASSLGGGGGGSAAAASGGAQAAGGAASTATDTAGDTASSAESAGSAASGAMGAAEGAMASGAAAAGSAAESPMGAADDAMGTTEGAIGDAADAASEATDDLTGGPSTGSGA